MKRSGTDGWLVRGRLWVGLTAALVLPALVTAALLTARFSSGLPLAIPIYLLSVVAVALIGRVIAAILAAVLSSLLINWFFVLPVGTFRIADPENFVVLVVFALVGALVAVIVDLNARRTEEAQAAQRESAALVELSHSLLGSNDQLPLLLRSAIAMFGVTAAAIVRTTSHGAEVVASTGRYDALAPTERAAAGTHHELVLQPAGLGEGEGRLFAAFAAHAGAILQRQELQRSADSAALLARDNAARTALLSAVSHDLRTPLAGIKAAIGSLRSDEVTWSPEDEEELKEAIEESADRLEALIGNLLDMSRLQAGALIARVGPIDLGEVIPLTVAMLSDPSRVAWEIDPYARVVQTDAGLLDRVLGNISENALRYQPAGSPVHIRAMRVADRVEIRVSDTGVGVPPAELDRIFQPFQRRGDVPGRNGLGLGLAVARGLAEAMGGRVDAELTPGGGLTMVVRLPTRAHQTLPSPDPAGGRRP